MKKKYIPIMADYGFAFSEHQGDKYQFTGSAILPTKLPSGETRFLCVFDYSAIITHIVQTLGQQLSKDLLSVCSTVENYEIFRCGEVKKIEYSVSYFPSETKRGRILIQFFDNNALTAEYDGVIIETAI